MQRFLQLLDRVIYGFNGFLAMAAKIMRSCLQFAPGFAQLTQRRANMWMLFSALHYLRIGGFGRISRAGDAGCNRG